MLEVDHMLRLSLYVYHAEDSVFCRATSIFVLWSANAIVAHRKSHGELELAQVCKGEREEAHQGDMRTFLIWGKVK
jgi:hypothetical protein